NEGAGVVTITLARTNGFTGVVTVNYLTSSGSATAGSDYVASSGILTFADGESSQSFTIPILDETAVEGDETFFVAFTNATGGGVISGLPSAIVLIEDNETGSGSLDRGFNPGAGANGLVRTLALQADGKIVLGGAFTQFDNLSRNFITRLNTNGS